MRFYSQFLYFQRTTIEPLYSSDVCHIVAIRNVQFSWTKTKACKHKNKISYTALFKTLPKTRQAQSVSNAKRLKFKFKFKFKRRNCALVKMAEVSNIDFSDQPIRYEEYIVIVYDWLSSEYFAHHNFHLL